MRKHVWECSLDKMLLLAQTKQQSLHTVADRRDELRAVRLEADVVDDALDAVAVWDAVGPGRHAAHGGGSAGRAPPPRPVRARAILTATLQ